MTVVRSLGLRLVLYMIIFQTIAIIIAWLSIIGASVSGIAGDFDTILNDFAYYRVRDFVIESLRQSSDGSLLLEPTPSLRALGVSTPTLQYAVLDPNSNHVLPGSSSDLAAALATHGRLKLRDTYFSLGPDPNPSLRGYVLKYITPYGLLNIAAYGYRFHWSDVFFVLKNDRVMLSSYLLSAFTASAIASFFAVRHGLTPLRAAAEQAALLDMNSLGQGIAESETPTEVRPLIKAINNALARVDASATRIRRFTADAAHELRTPIAILRARLENPKQPTFVDDLLRDANRIQVVYEQLLIATRLIESQTSTDHEVDLTNVIWRIVADYWPLVIDSGRGLEFEPSDTPVFVRGNAQAIERVIVNLIDNALRVEPDGGTVLVRVGSDAVIEVIDHGVGIAISDREKIFKPFWSKSEATSGHGLGLAIANEIISANGGRIWVEDTPGGGATFKLSFPPVPKKE